jgi:hypothetical protein
MARIKFEQAFRDAEDERQRCGKEWEEGRAKRDEWMTSDRYEKKREAWLLGRFADVYNSEGSTQLIEVEFGERPDSVLYDAAGRLIGGAEVTEWIEPWRKRDKEYSGNLRSAQGRAR